MNSAHVCCDSYISVPQITLVIWTVIRIGPNGCDSMEFHESGLLRFKQKADMGVVHPLHKSTVGGRKDQDLVFVGNNNPVRIREWPKEKNGGSVYIKLTE